MDKIPSYGGGEGFSLQGSVRADRKEPTPTRLSPKRGEGRVIFLGFTPSPPPGDRVAKGRVRGSPSRNAMSNQWEDFWESRRVG